MRNLLTVLSLFLGVSASAMPGPQINGNQINPQSAISISTLTVTGAQGLAVTGPVVMLGSATVSGGGGIGVTYGISAATGAFSTGISAGTGSFTGGGGVSVTYGITAATGAFSAGMSASTGSFNGANGVQVTYGVAVGSITAADAGGANTTGGGAPTAGSVGNFNNTTGTFGVGTGNTATVNIDSNNNFGTDIGGRLALGGRAVTGNTGHYTFAMLIGAKENSSSNDFGGYLALRTWNNGDHSKPLEAMRINSSQQVGVGTAGTIGATFDVSGTAQFGSGVNKSTFSTTGALTLASGSAVTTSGSAGNIISASSITTTGSLFGNGLAVGGSSITSAGALTLTPGAAINVSGANGNIIGTSSITTTGSLFGAALVINAGGTTPTANFTPSLSSTSVAAVTGTSVQTAFAVCQATVTVDLTGTVSGNVMLIFTGAASHSILNDVINVGILNNGAYMNFGGGAETSAVGVTTAKEQVATDNNNMSFTVVATGLSLAAHNFCIGFWSSASTITIDSTLSKAVFRAVMMP